MVLSEKLLSEACWHKCIWKFKTPTDLYSLFRKKGGRRENIYLPGFIKFGLNLYLLFFAVVVL